MYRLSKYWNRIAYFIMKLGRKMIWDYTGKNKDMLEDEPFWNLTERIMCDRK